MQKWCFYIQLVYRRIILSILIDQFFFMSLRSDGGSRDLQNLSLYIWDGIPGWIWKCVGGLYSSSKGEGIARRKAEKKERTLVRFEPGAGYSPPMKLLRGRRSEKERAPSIFASLFQAEAGWFMRSGCRGSAPRENSRFQLRTQPCRQGGGVCRCLLFFLRGPFYGARVAMRLSQMTCNYRPSFFFFFLRSFAERFRRRQANHRATTSRLSYVRFEWTTCGFVQFVRNRSRKLLRSLMSSSSAKRNPTQSICVT